MTDDPFAAAQATINGNTAAPAVSAGSTTLVDDPFSIKPSEIKTADYPALDDLDGRILVIQPTKLEKDLPNNLGKAGETRDRITADVTVIDPQNPEGSKTYEDMYLSQGWLIGQLKGLVATRGMLLGILRKNRAKTTPEGFNTPDEIDKMISDWVAAGARGNKPMFAWKMMDPSEADRQLALRWYRSRQG